MITGSRRWVTTASLLGVIAVVFGATAGGKLARAPSWTMATISALAALGVLLLDPIKKLWGDWLQRSSEHHKILQAHLRMRSKKGKVQRVCECSTNQDALALGVHPAASTDGDKGLLPPYVHRNAHDNIGEQLSVDASGIVIIEGPSAAGKSRLAFQVMQEYLSDRWLIVPEDTHALLEIRKAQVALTNAVIWLDDVERYLTTGGLTPGILDALCPRGSSVLILATLRSEARRELTASNLDLILRYDIHETLKRAQIIRLSRDLTSHERVAAEAYRTNPIIAAALDQRTRAGFAEYIAAGPAALERWQSAMQGEQQVAAGIISAAIDLRRAGHQQRIRADLLRKVYVLYLDSRTQSDPRAPDFEASLEWASRPVNGASGCIHQIGDNEYEPFDYLTDFAQGASTVRDIPPQLWEISINYADPMDLLAIGFAAFEAGNLRNSERAFKRAIEEGTEENSNHAVLGLGLVLLQSHQLKDAEKAFERWSHGDPFSMIEIGKILLQAAYSDDIGDLFRRADDRKQKAPVVRNHQNPVRVEYSERADEWLKQAVNKGSTPITITLGEALLREGYQERADHWFKQTADHGDTADIISLGVNLLRRGYHERADHWLGYAADKGGPTGMLTLGMALLREGYQERADHWFKQTADHGDTADIISLVMSLLREGYHERADHWSRELVNSSGIPGMTTLSRRLFTEGYYERAEYWLGQVVHIVEDTRKLDSLANLLESFEGDDGIANVLRRLIREQ
jgi:uncharacterized protein